MLLFPALCHHARKANTSLSGEHRLVSCSLEEQHPLADLMSMNLIHAHMVKRGLCVLPLQLDGRKEQRNNAYFCWDTVGPFTYII